MYNVLQDNNEKNDYVEVLNDSEIYGDTKSPMGIIQEDEINSMLKDRLEGNEEYLV